MLEKFQAGKLSLDPDQPELDVQVYKGGVMKHDQKKVFNELRSRIKMVNNKII